MNRLERIKAIKEELAILEEEVLKEGEPKQELEYPIYKQGTDRINDAIVKFISLREGKVVYVGSSILELNDFDSNWRKHTDTNIWKDIVFDEERGLYDKQLIWCYDNSYTHIKTLGFYDAKNKKSYSCEGLKNGDIWDNYEPYEGDCPEWAIEAYKTLED